MPPAATPRERRRRVHAATIPYCSSLDIDVWEASCRPRRLILATPARILRSHLRNRDDGDPAVRLHDSSSSSAASIVKRTILVQDGDDAMRGAERAHWNGNPLAEAFVACRARPTLPAQTLRLLIVRQLTVGRTRSCRRHACYRELMKLIIELILDKAKPLVPRLVLAHYVADSVRELDEEKLSPSCDSDIVIPSPTRSPIAESRRRSRRD